MTQPQIEIGERAPEEVARPRARKSLCQLALQIAPLLLALIGIALRLQRYLLGRSFRNDEAALALAIEGHSLPGLILQPLPGGLTAPVGFLVTQKVIAEMLGSWDYVYRLLPLLAGCASVVLMLILSRRLLRGPGTVFALGTFSVSWMLLFYASDNKQYSTDVFFCVLLYLLAAVYMEAGGTRNAVLLTAGGLLALSFSHPAIFVLASIGLVMLLQERYRRRSLAAALGIILAWLAWFAVLYFKYYRVVGEEIAVVDYWSNLDGLMPIPPWEDPGWFVIRAGSFFTTVVGLSRAGVLYLALLGLGIAALYWQRRWQWSLMLLGTILLTLAGSALVNYPFKGRLILFLIPPALLAMGAGVDALMRPRGGRTWYLRGLAWALAFALLWTPARSTLDILGQRRSVPYREDLKPALSFLEENWQNGDLVVVEEGAVITYEFYASQHGLAEAGFITLPNYRNHPRRYRRALDELPGDRRTWFVFSNVLDMPDGTDVRTFVLDHLLENGSEILTQYNYDGVSFVDLTLKQ